MRAGNDVLSVDAAACPAGWATQFDREFAMRWLVCLVVWAAPQCLPAAGPYIELTVNGQPQQGLRFAHDDRVCWLLGRDGRLTEVALADVTAFRAVDAKFAPLTGVELRNQLRSELPKEYELVARGAYVVCGPRGRVGDYAEVLDRVHRNFSSQLRRRNIDVAPLQFPLVAFVTPSQEEFFERCELDKVPVSDAIRGYYSVESNWITFYDRPDDDPQRAEVDPRRLLRPSARRGRDDELTAGRPEQATERIAEMVAGPSLKTTVHEAIHQLAFNLGLHARLANNPKWVVEGLAMLFETGYDGEGRPTGDDEVNLERLQMFAEYRNNRRSPGALVETIASDRLFQENALDAYGEAWALTHYLASTRSAKHHQYLRRLSERNALGGYGEADRLADFQAVFGDDLAWLEVEYIRTLDRLIDKHLPDLPRENRSKMTASRGSTQPAARQTSEPPAAGANTGAETPPVAGPKLPRGRGPARGSPPPQPPRIGVPAI